MTLAEALANVELEPGRTYECRVQGKRVVVQVSPGSLTEPAARFDESDVMLDAWCDLPMQGKRVEIGNVRYGKLPVDIPDIPQDDE
jgi:hypothetical protein